MRYFGGLTNEQVADALEISIATVKHDWAIAQGYLLRDLTQEDACRVPDVPDPRAGDE